MCTKVTVPVTCVTSGYWRLLEADYVEQAVQHILALLEEKDWPWTRVPLSSTSHHLQELLPRLLLHTAKHPKMTLQIKDTSL